MARPQRPPPPPAPAPAATNAAPAFAKAPGRLLLPDGQVFTFPPPREGETRRVHAYGRTYVCDHLGNFRDVTPRRLFHTAFEANFLALASEGRAFIPAFLLGLDEADVRALLARGREPLGDETEDELRRLAAYDEMRRAVLDYMDAGGRFDDFVEEAAAFGREERLARAAGLREVMTLWKAGRLAEAKAAAEAADGLAARSGYRPVALPPRVRAALGALPAGAGAGGE